jgi:hypothetical protein
MSRYEDDIFGDECYDGFDEHGLVKDNAVNKIKTKGIGKTKLKLNITSINNNSTEDKEIETPIVKLTKEEIMAAKIIEKKRKREEAIAKSKAEVALREQETAELKEKEATELRKKEAEALNEEADWDAKSF